MEFRKYERRINSLLAIQKLLMPKVKTKKLLMTEKELKELTDCKVKCYSKIISNSEEIIKNTTDPEAFFKHLNLFFNRKNELYALLPYI